MEEKTLKTSTWQRVIIIVIAILLLGSTVLTYMFVVMGSSNSGSSASNDEKVNELIAQYDAKQAEIDAAAKPLSDKYFPEFKTYQSKVKAYNSATANSKVLETEDLKVGTGKTLAEGDTNYAAYYLGWCADGSVFDSSFNNEKDTEVSTATGLVSPLDPSGGLIEGWNQGVVGMKLGGVRQITMSGDLAYGDTREICGGYGSPLKFIVMAIEPDETVTKLNKELNDIYLQLYMAMYGSN